jgi:hypothetical protein
MRVFLNSAWQDVSAVLFINSDSTQSWACFLDLLV